MTSQPSPALQQAPPPTPAFRAGLVAIVGRANVGKSTLLNILLGTKLAAVSPKPQTSRHRLLGVLHREGFQIGLLDTPGWPSTPRPDALASRMIREATEALETADLAVLVVDPRLPGDIERKILEDVAARGIPALVAINKIDTVKKPLLLPVIAAFVDMSPVREVVPVSALHEDGLDVLLQRIVAYLPEREPLFEPDELTDRSERFIVAELVREKVFELYGQEIPYATAVRVEEFKESDPAHGGKDYIEAVIYVERPSQKVILVGHEGQALKAVGSTARPEIERVLGRQVYLSLWVKTQPRWRKDPRFLKSLEEQ